MKGATVVAAAGNPLDLGNFSLCEHTVQCLHERGVTYLFEIQAKTFGLIRNGTDVIGRARTGMGKTLAFVLPLCELLNDAGHGKFGRPPIGVILAPTRELAVQIVKEVESVAKGYSVLALYGGTPYPPQFQALRTGVDVVVGTPGRIKDHLEKQTLDLVTRCKFAVCVCPPRKQIMLFLFLHLLLLPSLSPYRFHASTRSSWPLADTFPPSRILRARCPN